MNEGLPVAIQILLMIESSRPVGTSTLAGVSSTISVTTMENVSYYRTVIRLPTAMPTAMEDTEATSMGM
jgi:hypothetical protein